MFRYDAEDRWECIGGCRYLDEMQYATSYSEARRLCDTEEDSDYRVCVLTIAHLNHDIQDNRHENLAALCPRCHLRHDAKYHAQNAAKTRLAKKAAGSLFKETDNV